MTSPSAAGLPGKLADVAALTSVEVAEILARAWGGRRRYVPAEPKPDHELSRLVGHDNARIIGAAMGNEEIKWPNAKAWLHLHDARRLLDEGVSIAGIAKRLGISDVRARTLLRGYGAPRAPGSRTATVAPRECPDCHPARRIADRVGLSEQWVFQLISNAHRIKGQPQMPAPTCCPTCRAPLVDVPRTKPIRGKRPVPHPDEQPDLFSPR
ncbi:hypothetical protein HL658_31280 [Azospirillum sp. RWY-5-1]|uniref:Helix-turn-helix domain-containing protein n=1 Tax=Azospirillum oleiclasticum TaxID=2735135 RepID=A0ABX2TJR2_9PROT|nr:hypothetical protein [Azospirillum oleiclasticum]NYZ17048.1 hypothetical protein [Azospirillum oleiclasticum]NYZ24508.1 hypothetical protein [Azospirillum oleiclasticum]